MIFSFLYDFVVADFGSLRRQPTFYIEDMQVQENMTIKEVGEYIEKHAVERSNVEIIFYILGRYKYSVFWTNKIKIFILFFLSTFTSCYLLNRKIIKREIS